MKKLSFYIFLAFLGVSCTSNTIYKEPKNLIPKDSMVALLTDMYLAASAKNIKDSLDRKTPNYTLYVYEKYKIDSTRFESSNIYYTSKIDEYSKIIKEVKNNLKNYELAFVKIKKNNDSLKKVKLDMTSDSIKKGLITKEEVLKRNSSRKKMVLKKTMEQ